MKAAGWECTALDQDERLATHAQEVAGVKSVCGDFMAVQDIGHFDMVTFNKVLEHVEDPVAMLAKSVRYLHADSLVYVEVPDGELAAADGQYRNEFFIDHLHVFSAASLALLGARAGFALQTIERLQGPSGKHTLRAFLVLSAVVKHETND